MHVIPLLSRANHGFTHKIRLTAADLATLTTATAASIFPALNVATTFAIGLRVRDCAAEVETAFTHAATAVFSVGDGGDAARFVAASTDLKTAAFTEGAITKRPYIYTAADTIDITCTLGSGAMTTIAAGVLNIYLALYDMTDLRLTL